METGYGLETILPDGYLKRLQMRTMIPLFKKNEYSEGLRLGLEQISDRILKNQDGLVDEIPALGNSSIQNSKQNDNSLWLGLAGGGGILIGGGVWYRRKKRRRCPDCKRRLLLLDEQEDDRELEPGQIIEEEIGAVNYKVWYCPEDGFVRIFQNKKWFSGFSKCRNCQHQTLSLTNRTLIRPTQNLYGKEEIIETCSFCDYTHTYHRTIPRTHLGTTRGGGGFSGGSFGGGASGGGGAGSSW